MRERGGQRKAEERHESLLHNYTITVISVITETERPFTSASEQLLAPKPKLQPKFSSSLLPLECAKPAHKPQMCPKCLSLQIQIWILADLHHGVTAPKKLWSLFTRRFLLSYGGKWRWKGRLLHVPTSIRESRNLNTYLCIHLLWRQLTAYCIYLTCPSWLLQT